MKDFSLKEEIEKLEKKTSRQLNIIALFYEKRQPDLRTKEQYAVSFKRQLRPARDLVPFDNDQILNAIKKAKEFIPGWTLETIVKLVIK